tara:strand:- start:333 stop:905 length:573 start_codon:yes stop_codon:yes gene_type:complete
MPILTKGTTFSNGEQLTADKLNDLLDLATFNQGATDSSSTTVNSSGQLIVNDGGVTFAKLTDVIDDDTMSTATATTLATSESIKAYVDSSDSGFTPSTYAGETSITFPNGLIMKLGTVSVTLTNQNQSHTFKDAAGNLDPFPTACVHLSGSRQAASSYGSLSVTTKNKDGWSGSVINGQNGTYDYIAYGY